MKLAVPTTCRRFLPVAVGLAIAAVVPAGASAGAVVFSAAGANAAAIQATVDAFRASLGMNNGVGGTFTSGRREINWDGVPDAFAAPNNLPANFFNVNSPRGVVFSTPGAGFEVSANAANATATPVEFGDIDPSYPSTFGVFSPQRLFTALGSIVTDVSFFIPGTNTPARTSAFGAVFTDADLADVTSLEFFDSTNKSLGTFFVPPASGAETLSFLGVLFDAGEEVARVEITAGNAALAPGITDSNGAPHDLVVMDDFIYGEPQAQHPTAVLLLTSSVTATRRGVVIRWRTGVETSTLGFDVFRELNGIRTKINRTLIPSDFRGEAIRHSHAFVDRKAASRGGVRYWIRATSASGLRSWFGPIALH